MPRGHRGSSACCQAAYGLAANTSAITVPSDRNEAVAASPASGSPDQQPPTATMGLPWADSGRNGTGGAVVRFTSVVSSSGAPAQAARKPRSTCSASSAGEKTKPEKNAG